jgi:hypothetical protein
MPEKQLWHAVLMQAVDDFVGNRVSLRGKPAVMASQAAAQTWFFSDGHELGSFLLFAKSSI